MSLGLPVHLVPHHVRRGISNAAHTVALVCLVGAFFIVLSVQADYPSTLLWPGLIAIGIMLIALWQVEYYGSIFSCVAYLIVGSACIYWIAIIALNEYPGEQTPDNYVLSMAKVALIMVGGAGITIVAGIAWSLAGFLLASATTALAVWQSGFEQRPDFTSIGAFLLVTALQIGLEVGGQRRRLAQPSLHRAARDEELSAMRNRIEAKAAALMHDTVLNHLAAIAATPTGVLDQRVLEQVERDLELLVGEEWLLDTEPAVHEQATDEWLQSRLAKAIDEVRELGLVVDVSGDVTSINRLGGERSNAVALAAKQCLVNVLKHAGTDRAEVVVYGSDYEVSVMVIDAGKGFSEAEMGADRLGLRQSVRRRIESVGGHVQVWSTPGRGTSVMIRLPALEPEVVIDLPGEPESEVAHDER